MILTCYACKQDFSVVGWNPSRVIMRCPQSICGRAVYVALAAKRMYGDVVGIKVDKIIESIVRICDKVNLKSAYDEHVANLVDKAAKQIEILMHRAEKDRQQQRILEQGDAVATLIPAKFWRKVTKK